MRKLSRKWTLISSAVVFVFAVFYIEILSYIVNTRYWSPLFKVHSSRPLYHPKHAHLEEGGEDEEPLRVLLVADPQIIGEKNELPFLGLFTRWDADRFLQRNYMLAKYHVQPHVVAFLGDLFDEGLNAVDAEYRRYYKRFKGIFQLPRKQDPPLLKYIFIPGDNDIGGESEDVDTIKLKWFNQTFGDFKKEQWVDKGPFLKVQFLPMNMFIPEEYQDPIKGREHLVKDASGHSMLPSNYYRIILSHTSSIVRYKTSTFNKLMEKLRPHVIFTGHSHLSTYTRLQESEVVQRTDDFLMPHKHDSQQWTLNRIPSLFNRNSNSNNAQDNPDEESLLQTSAKITLNLHLDKLNGINVASDGSRLVHEISIPTCSYRMGVPHVGYGAFNLYKNGTLEYTILWLPSRLNQLYAYLCMTLSLILCACFWYIFRKCQDAFRGIFDTLPPYGFLSNIRSWFHTKFDQILQVTNGSIHMGSHQIQNSVFNIPFPKSISGSSSGCLSLLQKMERPPQLVVQENDIAAASGHTITFKYAGNSDDDDYEDINDNDDGSSPVVLRKNKQVIARKTGQREKGSLRLTTRHVPLKPSVSTDSAKPSHPIIPPFPESTDESDQYEDIEDDEEDEDEGTDEDTESLIVHYVNEKETIGVENEGVENDTQSREYVPYKPPTKDASSETRQRTSISVPLTRHGTWNQYSKNLHDPLPLFSPRSVTKLLSKKELQTSSPTETRLLIGDDYLFKIIPTVDEEDLHVSSLFQAIAQAISGTPLQAPLLQHDILKEVVKNWKNYWEDMEEHLGQKPHSKSYISPPSSSTFKRFKQCVTSSDRDTPVFLLKAAGKLYNFKCVLFTVKMNDNNKTPHASVEGFAPTLKSEPEITIFLLRRPIVSTNSSKSSWYYELLSPLSPIQRRGAFYQPSFRDLSQVKELPILMYHIILIDHQRLLSEPETPTNSQQFRTNSLFSNSVVGFHLLGRTYFLLPTVAHDLWSLVSEMIIKNLAGAPKIFSLLLETKQKQAVDHRWGKVRKGSVTKGILPPSETQLKKYGKAMKVPFMSPGDLSDLPKIADLLKFSYLVIGHDTAWNKYFWTERTDWKDEHDLKLFVKLSSTTRKATWHALVEEDPSRSILRDFMAKQNKEGGVEDSDDETALDGESGMSNYIILDPEGQGSNKSMLSRQIERISGGLGSFQSWLSTLWSRKKTSSPSPSTSKLELVDDDDDEQVHFHATESSHFEVASSSVWKDEKTQKKLSLTQKVSKRVSSVGHFFKSGIFSSSSSKRVVAPESTVKISDLPVV